MQLTLRVTHQTPHGASCLVLGEPGAAQIQLAPVGVRGIMPARLLKGHMISKHPPPLRPLCSVFAVLDPMLTPVRGLRQQQCLSAASPLAGKGQRG